ncbi:MAG: long-chain fatty acid--CoA ligase [Alphaproteobacteria bacterium]|nr:MAG: long-chain fatty acid--CoA ligase [Alphaproteobacteria bacterium]
MLGLMQDQPLLITTIMNYAALYHREGEVVTKAVEGGLHRTTYGEVSRRSAKLAHALTKLGINQGDCVSTMAWNSYRHLELYLAVPCKGSLLNTINPRLFPDQILYILAHSEAKILFLDLTFVPLLEKLADKITGVEKFVIMTDRAHMPETTLDNILCYEELIAPEEDQYDWPDLDENTAAIICYTSGTTGEPKGALYSHRSTVLHCFSTCSKDSLGISNRDTILPIVPMFHVNAWGTPFAAIMTGCKLVLPGADMTGENFFNLLKNEECTISLGVPTIWLALLQYANSLDGNDFTDLAIESFVIGGSAAAPSLIEDLEKTFDATVLHAWGMTETSPLGSVNRPMAKHASLSEAEKMALKIKQGRPPFGIEMKIVDDDGIEMARDGVAFGRLMVRGPWVIKAYFKQPELNILDDDGYFDTGDVSTLDTDGYMTIVDRSKDVIKSGGEWISSIDLENVALGQPQVAEAAVIGIAHPKWQERPLLIILPIPGTSPTKADILAYLDGKIAKWWTPDDVLFIDEMPHTATGKIQKRDLREIYKDYKFTD